MTQAFYLIVLISVISFSIAPWAIVLLMHFVCFSILSHLYIQRYKPHYEIATGPRSRFILGTDQITFN
jgi:hypothetical protein